MARDKLIAFRRGTAAAWTSANPTLGAGEPGVETDTGKVKIGDGTTAWASLAYVGGSGAVSSVFGRTGAVVAATNDYSEAQLSFTDITTNNVSSSKHGLAPKSPADSTKFLDGSATPAWDTVKDSDLSTSDITTNDVSTSKHGFTPKAPNDTSKFLRGDGTWAVVGGVTSVVATDTIWDAAGDLAVGTGADAASRLALGASAKALVSNGSTAIWDFPPGYEVGYDQITSSVNITGTSEGSPTTVLTCAAHTFDGSPVLCTFFSIGIRAPQVDGGFIAVGLYESTTFINRLIALSITSDSGGSVPDQTLSSLMGALRFTPSAGSHTYIIKAWVSSTTGTPLVAAGSGGTGANPPAWARFTKV